MDQNKVFASCLRPDFTRKVAGWLEKGYAVNIYGTEDKGIHRLVDDLGGIVPEGTRFIPLNMKGLAYSYTDFISSLASGLGLDGGTTSDVKSVISNYLSRTSGMLWLCITHFEQLAEKQVEGKPVDVSGYDIHFLNYLNSLRNTQQVALLICSNQLVKNQELYVGGQKVNGSRIEFSERHALPDLSFTETEDYLLSRMDETIAQQIREDRPIYLDELIVELNGYAQSIGLTEFIANQKLDPKWDRREFKTYFNYWKKAFRKNHSASIDRKIGQFERETNKWYNRLGRLLGIGKIWGRMHTRLKILIGILAAIAAGLYKYGEQLFNFISK
jgi:hypothetical protein